MTTKEKIAKIVADQPEDVTYEEIIRELAFAAMVERGLKDVEEGRVFSSEQAGQHGGLTAISMFDLALEIAEPE
ncbi:MAG: hypothetical protein ACOC2L_03425 [Candidatus Sumerlaeota bacterium]